jgi:tetratricopeptide (TPR) repeat protein
LSYFDRAVIVAPTHAKSLRYRAKCLADLGKKDEALVAYERALFYNTSSAEIYTEYAQLCSDNAKYQRAAELYEQAYRLKSSDQTLLSLGNTYNMLNDLDQALVWYKKLEARNPSSPAVLYNIAYTFKKLGRLEEAFPYYRKVLALEPGHADAHFGLGLSYLITGDFENGFREYEYRWGRDKKTKRSPKSPEWDGCALLEGKTFLLIAEQGLGDTFQFIRFGKVLREQYGAERVIAAVQKPLVQLLSLCPYLDQVVALGSPLPTHDYHAHTVSMPYLCKITRETTPTPIPYLFADEKLVELWHEKLAESDYAHEGLCRDSSESHPRRLRVGICWQGNPNYSTQFLRSVVAAKSITLTKLLPLFSVPGVSFYNLQKMTGEEQLKLLPEGTPLISFGEDFDKDHGRFMDTAAVMKNLDLMITVDTGTAHISAALGVPTWTFIPEPPDWRWMLTCTDTPWYPNMRLFRQPSIGDWETTITLVCKELEKLVAARHA